MGSSKKKKAAKRKKGEDFQKVKLKVGGRKLPKGSVTDTTFKAKKVVIREQLRSRSAANELEHWNRMLNHRNPNVQLESLQHFCSKATKTQDRGAAPEQQLHGAKQQQKEEEQMRSAVEHACVLISSGGSGKVRRAALEVLRSARDPNGGRLLLNGVIPLAVAHLRCALSRGEQGVERDALGLLDLLLQQHIFGRLPPATRTTLFHDLLRHISSTKRRNKGVASETFVLRADPSRSTSALQWHAQIIHRMHQMLPFLPCVTSTSGSSFSSTSLSASRGVLETGKLCVIYSHSARVMAPMYDACVPSLFEKDQRVPLEDNGAHAGLRVLIGALMPLLQQVWKEAQSERKMEPKEGVAPGGGGGGDTLCMELAEMAQILGRSCYERSAPEFEDDEEGEEGLFNWYCGNFGRPFASLLLAGFPYSQSEAPMMAPRSKKSSSKKTEALAGRGRGVNLTMMAHRLNLIVCDFVIFLELKKAGGRTAGLKTNFGQRRVIEYLFEALGSIGVNEEGSLFQSAAMVVEHGTREEREAVRDLLKRSFESMGGGGGGASGHPGYLHVLRLLVHFMEKQQHMLPEDKMDAWIASKLSRDLMAFASLDDFRLEEEELFAYVLQQKRLLPLISALFLPHISDAWFAEKPDVWLTFVFSMFHWAPVGAIDRALLTKVLHAFLGGVQGRSFGDIIGLLRILNHRIQTNSEAKEAVVVYYSFMFSLCIGMSRKSLEEQEGLQREEAAEEVLKRLKRQKELSEAALRAISDLCSYAPDLLTVHCSHFLYEVLLKNNCSKGGLHVASMYGVLRLVAFCWNSVSGSAPSMSFLPPIVTDLGLCLLARLTAAIGHVGVEQVEPYLDWLTKGVLGLICPRILVMATRGHPQLSTKSSENHTDNSDHLINHSDQMEIQLDHLEVNSDSLERIGRMVYVLSLRYHWAHCGVLLRSLECVGEGGGAEKRESEWFREARARLTSAMLQTKD